MIAGLVAQNYTSVFDAVRLAIYLHGLAGDTAAGRLGEESVTATAILEAIPDAFRISRKNV
jgi:NAD(P)H-hydrate epimerase